jgi:hypothetical protein
MRPPKSSGRPPTGLELTCSDDWLALAMLTRPELQGGRGEIQSGAEQCRHSKSESGGNRKANVRKPIEVTGGRALGTRSVGDWFAFADVSVLGSIAVWNYERFPVRSTFHAQQPKRSVICSGTGAASAPGPKLRMTGETSTPRTAG